MYGYQIIIHYKVSYYLFYPHLLPITILELGQHAKFDEWDKRWEKSNCSLIKIKQNSSSTSIRAMKKPLASANKIFQPSLSADLVNK